MPTGKSDDQFAAGLSRKVVERLHAEPGVDAEKIIRCLGTAEVLLGLARTDDRGLRWAESAAYNLREALNAVVEGRDQAAEGGLAAVLKAWQVFQVAIAQPAADTVSARVALDEVLARVAANTSRASYYARKLVGYLQDRAGVSPLSHRRDPVAEYDDLRGVANRAVHTGLTLADAASLQTRTITWFVRMFTPPDEVVDAIRRLAAEPWQGHDQIRTLEQLLINGHHLRLFLSELTDPAWLEPLRLAGLVTPSPHEGPWPGAALLDGLARVQPQSVAVHLERLLADTKSLPNDERVAARFELLRVATHLGPAGYGVVATVSRQQGDLSGVRALAVDVAVRADPADMVVEQVARAVLNDLHQFRNGDHYYATTILDHIQAGITADNVAGRTRMLAGKTRHQAGTAPSRYLSIGIEALSGELGEHPEPLVLLAHHLTRALAAARGLGVPTATQLEWLKNLSGELGDRIRSQVFAGADDVALTQKIDHMALRLMSQTATGDDLALVADILAHDPAPEDLAGWTAALGTPSAAPTEPHDIPQDWARAWRWAAILPTHLLAGWKDPIDHVSHLHGQPDPGPLTRAREPGWRWLSATSPISADELAAKPVLEAAEQVASWQPTTDRDTFLSGPLELARELEITVASDPARWAVDPATIITTLRKPIYIEYYLRAVTAKAAEILEHAPAIVAACLHARTNKDPSESNGGVSDADRPSQTSLDGVVLDLAKTLADHGADIAASLDELWAWTRSIIDHAADSDQPLGAEERDPLGDAMTSLSGRSLETVLALAAWEFRVHGAARPEFERILDTTLGAAGAVGLQYRALLATRRALLETIARPWLDTRAAGLFRDGPLAGKTFDLTIQWAPPTLWLYQNLQAELFAVARRNIDNATRQLAAATLEKVAGYDLDTIIRQLSPNPDTLESVAEEVAFLAQQTQPGVPRLTAAVDFWNGLLDTIQPPIPAQALHGLGRWAFVTSVDDHQWAELTARTLAATNGAISYGISVADRAAAIPPSPTTRGILRQLLDTGESWERHHAAGKAIETLRASVSGPIDETFYHLRTRLIDLGHHEASDVVPNDQE